MALGRKPIPTPALKLAGTYRKDRHAGRADATPPSGEPAKPAWLGEIDSAVWDQVVPDLIRRKLAGSSDSLLLAGMCRNFRHWRVCDEKLERDPTDKNVAVRALGFWAAFERTAAKFGLSASDLAGLKVPAEAKKGVAARPRTA